MRRQVRLVAARGLSLAIALALALIAPACARKKSTPAAQRAAATDGPPFRVDVAPPAGCRVGAPCIARIHVTALGNFHVNREFPFKLEPAPGQTAPEAAFSFDGEQRGSLSVTFRPAAAGTARVAGSFHLSVCNDETCVIEEVPVAIEVPTS